MPRLAAASLQLFASAAIVLCAAGTATAQPTEREMYVSVLDENGAPVTGLGPEDFVIREDGLAREVLRVRRATAPLQIALLVDTSRAATEYIRDIRVGLLGFVSAMHEGNELAVISIGEAPRIFTDYTGDLRALKAGVERIFAMSDAGTYALDGLVDVSRGLRKREAPRPVIVLVMAEGIEYSNYHYDHVLDALRDSGAAFHALVIGQGAADVLNDEIRSRNIVLDRGPKQSGGQREQLLTSMAVGSALERLAAELKNQYLVTYARPPSLIPPERTEVSAKNPALKARGTPVRAK